MTYIEAIKSVCSFNIRVGVLGEKYSIIYLCKSMNRWSVKATITAVLYYSSQAFLEVRIMLPILYT